MLGNYSDFYFHGMKFSLNADEALYNRAIVKMLDLYDDVKWFLGNNIQSNESISTLIPINNEYSIVFDISNMDWNIGAYNLETMNFDYCPVSSFCNNISQIRTRSIANNIARLHHAIERGEIDRQYTVLSDELQSKWDKYKASIPPEINYSRVFDMNLSDGVITNDDLRGAVKYAESIRDLSGIDINDDGDIEDDGFDPADD